MLESIYFETPLLVIPLQNDQYMDGYIVKDNNLGLSLSTLDLIDISNGKLVLVILQATTICLFDDEAIIKIFNSAKNHLSKEGKFILDRAIIEERTFTNNCGQPFITSWWSEEIYNVMWMQEFILSDLREIVLNVYGERIDGDETSRNIGYTRKRIITREIIENAVKSSGMSIERVIEENINNESKIEIFIIGRGDN